MIAEDTIKNEQKYIDKYNTIAPHGYNINIGGDLPPNHKGKTYREIYGVNWKEQIAKRMKTKKQNKNFGGVRKHSEESKSKISKALAGKNHPQWGKPLSEKRKRNISKARKGQFAGAKNPMLIWQEGALHLVKGDKWSIGGNHERLKHNGDVFTDHTFTLTENCKIFLLSDGMQDQFGGIENRKLSIRRIQDFLTESISLPMEEQQRYMEEKLEDWQGDIAQTDDILLMGITLS